jgi:DNA repair exonuclease SbcCD nuclease subunit
MNDRKALFKKAMMNFQNGEKRIKKFITSYSTKKGVTLSKNNFNNILMATNKFPNLMEKKRHVIKMFLNKKRTHTSESIKARKESPKKRKRTSFTPEKSWIARSLQN